MDGGGLGALVVGCGFGADAEYLSSLGFDVTAFDVAPTAVRAAQERHPGSAVNYVVADLLDPPQAWAEAFAFVFESLTVQSLPESVRSRAIARVGAFVAPRGTLLVVASARDEADGPPEGPPWPLTRAEVDSFARGGLEAAQVEALPGPRWRAEFRPPVAHAATVSRHEHRDRRAWATSGCRSPSASPRPGTTSSASTSTRRRSRALRERPLAHRGHPGGAARRGSRALHVHDALRRAPRGRGDPRLRARRRSRATASPTSARCSTPRAHSPASIAKGQLIVLESTTFPGTTREHLVPLLEESGLRAGEDFNLAFSPERVDPGRTDYTLRNTPKVVGGLTQACTDRAVELYGRVCDHVVPVSTPEVAELSKLLENIFRSVNIALVNEMAMLADRMGIDIWEVIDAAATKPFGFTRFDPGPGMGGHCLPVDPFYLTWKAREYDMSTEFIELAGKVNQAMPYFCLEKIERALNDDGKAVKGREGPGASASPTRAARATCASHRR